METDTLCFMPHAKQANPVCAHEFWPHGGWFHLPNGDWARLYVCADRAILRRAIVSRRNARWQFEVREHARDRLAVLIARQSMDMASRLITACWAAADRAACCRVQEVSVNREVSES